MQDVNLVGMTNKELNEFVEWAMQKISVARTILNQRANTARKSESEKYAAEKERHAKIGEVVRHILRIGDVVSVRGSKNKADGKIKSFTKNGVVLDRGYMRDGYWVPTNMTTEHMFDKISARYEGKSFQRFSL